MTDLELITFPAVQTRLNAEEEQVAELWYRIGFGDAWKNRPMKVQMDGARVAMVYASSSFRK